MIVDWDPVIVAGDEMPEDIDTTSSTYVTYIRKDIVPYEEFNDEGDQTFKGWKYLEAKISNADFVADKVKELVKENQELKEQNEALMLGMCDLYELNLGA